MSKNPSELEKITGYEFKDIKLLEQALTHSSYGNEHHLPDNERLEFLGDAVLELCSSDFLFKSYPDDKEGKMTTLRAKYVCEKALDTAARKIGLQEFIRLGRGEEASGGRSRASVVSDAFEAVLGAMYLDGGFEVCRRFVETNVLNAVVNPDSVDSKTALQEMIQAQNGPDPQYELAGEEGPDHDKKYIVDVYVEGIKRGRGTGSSKKRAEQAAAADALKKLGKVQV